MKQAYSKLHDKQGASLVLALFVMAVVMTLSIVMLRAAQSNAARVQSDQREKQAYLTVSSAAGLLRDTLRGESGRTWTESTTETYKTTTVTDKDDKVLSTTDEQTTGEPVYTVAAEDEDEAAAFAPLLGELLDRVHKNAGATGFVGVTETVTVEAADMDPVTMTLTIKPTDDTMVYELTAELSLEKEDGETPETDTVITLTATASVTQEILQLELDEESTSSTDAEGKTTVVITGGTEERVIDTLAWDRATVLIERGKAE